MGIVSYMVFNFIICNQCEI